MGTSTRQASAGIYRAWSFPTQPNSYNDLRLTERPLQDVNSLGPDSVLVKTHAVSLQYRDFVTGEGQNTNWFPVPPNLIPCSDAAGEVVAVGSDVKYWKVGDRVCANVALEHIAGPLTPSILASVLGGAIDGVLSEYRVYPARSLVKIPSYLSYEEASTLPCASVTAYNALLGLIPVKAGDVVLTLGTGGVSIAGLQIALASGASVIVTTSSKEKEEVIKKLGATHVINYKENPNWSEEVLRLTGGRGVDHVLENGGAQTLMQSIDSVKINGVVHLIGFLSGFTGTVPADIVIKSMVKTAIIRGIMAGSISQFQDLNRLLEKTKIVPVVDRVFSFEDAKEAYAYLESQRHVGKIVIKVTG